MYGAEQEPVPAPLGIVQSPKTDKTGTGIVVIPASVWAQPGEDRAEGGGKAGLLASSELVSASLQGRGLPESMLGLPPGASPPGI